MSRKSVELAEPVADFEDGHWHPSDVTLEPLPARATSSAELTHSKLEYAT